MPERFRARRARGRWSPTSSRAGPARWVRNRLLDALVEAGAGTLGWGRQAPLMADVRREAARQGRADILPMLAGEGAALSRTREPAADIVARLVRETEAVLTELAARA